MKEEDADRFCETCDRKRKHGQECMRESVCKDCENFYKHVGFCVAEKKEERKNGC